MRKAVGIPVHPNGRRIALAFAALTFVLAPTAEAAFSDVGVSVGLDTGGPKDGGVAWADFNLDGALDVLVSRTDGTGTRLYFSSGGAEPTFEDVTDTRASGLTRRTLGRAAVAADFNNDGLPDFARGGPARIEVYLNQGTPTLMVMESQTQPRSPEVFRTAAGSNGFEGDADPDTTTDPVAVDTDEDGLADGVEDANQDGAWTATIGGTGSQGDGETDPRNPDTDEDGITDGAEIEETMTDPLDSDTDDGTISDGEELAAGTDPNDPADDLEGVDTDDDGLNDSLEAVLGTDPEDADTDNDGVTDGAEIAAGDAEAYDPGVDSDPRDADTDDDGLADNTEIAGAGPLQRFAPTDPAQRDTDEDGISDGVEVGVFRPVIGGTSDGPAAIRYSGTDEEAFAADDDVETTTDPSVADTDSDGLLDGEEDLDANGAVSEEETDPNNADTDGGGAPDGVEVERGSDPLDPFDDRVVGEDRDGDALSDDEEADLGTDPDNADTDGDGLGDGREVFAVNPTDPLSADSDGDGLCDGALDAATCVAGEDLNGNARVDAGETDPNNPDTDSGGRSDGDEVRFDGTDPLDPDDDIQPADPEVRFRGAGLTACASSGNAGSSGWLILICAWLVRRASSDRRR